MEIFIQVMSSGLTLGAMYAVSTIGLALVYSALNMLNMSQGALLAFGGYICFYVMETLGLPAPVAMLAAMVVGGALGLAIYLLVARPMLGSPMFETQIFIATIGVGSVLQSVVLQLFGPQPKAQPLNVPAACRLGGWSCPGKAC